MDTVRKIYEPIVVHVRGSAETNNLRCEITSDLSEKHGYMNLDATQLSRWEAERCTEVGLEI